MSISRISSKEELLQHSESSTSIDINLDNDILLDEIENKEETVNENLAESIGEEEGEISNSFLDNLNNFGENLMSSVKTRQQIKEFKETIITDSTCSFSFGFKNVDKIFPENIELNASNSIPDWLNITYYSLNPARFDFDYTQQRELESVNRTFTMEHLFDVLPIIQKFTINGKTNPDKVEYMSQMLSRGVERKIHENHCVSDKVTGLWSHNTNQSSFSRTIINPLKFNKKSQKPENDLISDNISTQFPSKFHKGAIASLNSTGNIRLIDSNLKGEKIINYIDINSDFKTSYCSPHPIVDPFTGKMINVISEISLTSTRFKVVAFDDNSSSLISVVNSPISPIHTFGVTENYIVIISFPFYLKKGGLHYFTGDSILSSFDFNPQGLTTFYVISKKENKHIATYTTKCCYGLHIINAFETNKTICIDFSIYDNNNVVEELTVEKLRNGKIALPSPKIIRFSLDLNEVNNNNMANDKSTDANGLQASFDHFTQDISIELPVINQKYVGRNYKYAYGVALPFTDPTPGKYYDRIKKIDIENKQYISWSEPHCYPSQPIFVQNPSKADEEDEGAVLSVVYDGSKDESFLIILNAKDMTEITRITLQLPIPPSFSHAAAKQNN